jgi:hypothetical protein
MGKSVELVPLKTSLMIVSAGAGEPVLEFVSVNVTGRLVPPCGVEGIWTQ